MLNLSIVGLTDVTMDVTFNKSVYEPGTQIEAQVSLSQGGISLSGEYVSGGTKISDADVSAAVTIPGSADPAKVQFTSQGSGLYTGSLANAPR